MKILTLAAGIALALGGIASSAPASAQYYQDYHDDGGRSGYDRGDDGDHDRGYERRSKWDNHSDKRWGNDRRWRNDYRDDRRWRNHGRRCWTEWHHHRNVRVCR
ncbi:hypothetical protein [Sphingomonas sp.]|uniref:hypothetical protein n=1 Tax=Sphingomonas sp. TaxID=28214 RepID=UPI0025F52620|nr:hypothetical protein [Sphingomonas sp.]